MTPGFRVELNRDRHRRVLRDQSGLDVRGQHRIRGKDRTSGVPAPVGSFLRDHGPVCGAASIAGHLRADRAPVASQPAGDTDQRVTPLDPGTDLLAFPKTSRALLACWTLHRSRAVCRQQQHGCHHAPNGGTSALNCSRHPLNSPCATKITDTILSLGLSSLGPIGSMLDDITGTLSRYINTTFMRLYGALQ